MKIELTLTRLQKFFFLDTAQRCLLCEHRRYLSVFPNRRLGQHLGQRDADSTKCKGGMEGSIGYDRPSQGDHELIGGPLVLE